MYRLKKKKKKITVPLNKKLHLKKKIYQAAHLESSAIRLKKKKTQTEKPQKTLQVEAA